MAQPPQRISLGAGFLPTATLAPDHAPPPEDIPEAWHLVFRSSNASAAVYSGLFTSCQAGRAYALTTAPSARLRLDCDADQPADAWQRQLAAAKQALQTRGTLPTALHIQCTVPAEDSVARLNAIPDQLLGAGQGVTEVQLRVTDEADVSEFLVRLAAAFPSTASLTLDEPTFTLPPPTVWPQLTRLHVSLPSHTAEDEGQAAYTSIAQYLHQITHLTGNPANADLPWAPLFSNQQPSHTLTHFSTNVTADDELLESLLQFAPGLKQLTVGDIADDLSEYSTRQWRLECLTVMGGGVIEVETLACLPGRKAGAGRLELRAPRMELPLEVSHEEGLSSEDSARLSAHIFHTRIITLSCHFGIPITTLPTTLNQLSTLQAPDTTVKLSDWRITNDALLSGGVLAALAALTHLHFGLDMPRVQLNDAALAGLLQLGPRLRQLAVGQLDMQGEGLAGVGWPWDEIEMGYVSVGQLVKLPDPSRVQLGELDGGGSSAVGEGASVGGSGGGTAGGSAGGGTDGAGGCGTTGVRMGGRQRTCVRCRKLYFHPDILEVGVEKLTAWLTHVLWSSGSGTSTITLNLINPGGDNTALLHAQLSVLQAFEFKYQANTSVTVELWHWPMSQATMEALQKLPQLPGTLDMQRCVDWSLKADAYTHLATYVPLSYIHWVVPREISVPVFEAVCAGIAQRRAGLGLTPLMLTVPEFLEQPADVSREHVVVYRRPLRDIESYL